MDCRFARECWERAGMNQILENAVWVIEDFRELVLHVLTSQDSSKAETFGMVLWQIWKERNSKKWNGTMQTPSTAIYASAIVLKEWSLAKLSDVDGEVVLQRRRDSECIAWHRPMAGYLKINVDAAFFDELNQTGIDMIIRDEAGTFVLAKTKFYPSKIDVDVGEALGFFEAMSWMKNLGFEKVVIEGDSKTVVDAINANNMIISVLGDYVNACRHILRHNPEFSVKFVKRESNKLAHEFARASIRFGESHCWLDPPTFVDGLVNLHCVCNNGS